MLKIDVLHPLLSGIAGEEEKGISSYFLSQKLKMPEQKINYYLRKAAEDGFIKKVEHEWHLTNHVFFQNGFGIIYDKKHGNFSFIGCRYYGNCPCTGNISDSCKLLKDLSKLPIVKKFLNDLARK